MSLRETYMENMKQQLDELNVQMHQLESMAKEISEDTRNQYKVELRKLRRQSLMADEMFGELKGASDDAWAGMTSAAEKMRDTFIHSFRYFK